MEPSNTSEKKYKILQIVPRPVGGVEYHRQVIPHTNLMKYYPEFEVFQIPRIDVVPDDFLKQFQIVQFNRIISNFEQKNAADLAKLRRLGIISVCDLDDYWYLSPMHVLRKHFADHQIGAQTLECLMNSDHVTVTHELLGNMTGLPKKRWSILANAIDPEQPQFALHKKEIARKVEFGWVGGACHLEDIALMAHSFAELHKSELNYNLNLCGYSPDPIYTSFEGIFTHNGKATPDRYHRVAGTDVFNYANMYDLFDVAFVPLNDNLFNRCKSNLKLLEAGFKKKAVICQNIHPYDGIIKNGHNGLTVNITDNKIGWFKKIERYCNNLNMITDHAEQLYEDVQQFHIEKWTHVRAQLYKRLIEENKV